MLIDWPARHDEADAVSLLSTGFVVRCDSGRAAVRMSARYLRPGVAEPQSMGRIA